MLELSYLGIYVSLQILILIYLHKVINQYADKRTVVFTYIGINLVWLGYLYLLSSSGFVNNRDLPPRFPLFVFVPVFILIAMLLKWIYDRGLHTLVPKSWSVYYQTFRVVMEQAILFTAMQELIPIEATYKGYNYEFYFALTAPIIAYFAFTKKIIPNPLVVAWNLLGIILLVIVVSIIASSFFAPELWGYENQVVKDSFVKMPFILLPAFMVPSAIFMHLFSIVQVVASSRDQND